MTAREVLVQNVRDLLEFTKHSQVELAEHLGVSQPSISQKLHGARPFQLEELDAIAAFFHLSVPELFARNDEGHFERRNPADRRSGRDRRRNWRA